MQGSTQNSSQLNLVIDEEIFEDFLNIPIHSIVNILKSLSKKSILDKLVLFEKFENSAISNKFYNIFKHSDNGILKRMF